MRNVLCEIVRKEGTRIQKEQWRVPFEKGMRVLDALIHIQENAAPDLAFRWNCGEGICGSCAVEVNGRSVLACKQEITEDTKKITVAPLHVFPTIRDLVSDLSQGYAALHKLKAWHVGERKKKGTFYTLRDDDVSEASHLRRCIDCYCCTNTCHVRRNHPEAPYVGPQSVVRTMGFEKHPKNALDRTKLLASAGVGWCNVTRCCQEICPQGIRVTENALIPAKEKILEKKSLLLAILPFFRRKE